VRNGVCGCPSNVGIAVDQHSEQGFKQYVVGFLSLADAHESADSRLLRTISELGQKVVCGRTSTRSRRRHEKGRCKEEEGYYSVHLARKAPNTGDKKLQYA